MYIEATSFILYIGSDGIATTSNKDNSPETASSITESDVVPTSTNETYILVNRGGCNDITTSNNEAYNIVSHTARTSYHHKQK